MYLAWRSSGWCGIWRYPIGWVGKNKISKYLKGGVVFGSEFGKMVGRSDEGHPTKKTKYLKRGVVLDGKCDIIGAIATDTNNTIIKDCYNDYS